MKITVLNGSPKGITSVTMQYIHYIQKQFPQHELKILNVSQNISNVQKVVHLLFSGKILVEHNL